MKPIPFFLLFALTFFNSFAQRNEREQFTVPLTRVTFFEPGISHQIPAGRAQSFVIRAGLTVTADIDESSQRFGLLPRFFGSSSFRVYYNDEKRKARGLNTARNSANYFALLGLLSSKPLGREPYNPDLNSLLLNAGFVWGLQRNYHSRFSLDLNLGLGYLRSKNTSGFGPVGEFNLGFWLGKKQ